MSANLAIALSCLALVGIIWVWTLDRITFERAETIANAVRQNENLALAFEEHTIRTLSGVDQAISFIKNQYLERGLNLNLRQMIQSGMIDAGVFTLAGVIDERGDLVLNSSEAPPANASDREYFEFHRQNDTKEVYIGKPILGRVSQKWVVPISRRINKADGSFGGIAHISMDPEYFTFFYRKTQLVERGAISLVGLDGIARAIQIGNKSALGYEISRLDVFPAKNSNRSGTFLDKGKLDGVPRWVSYRALERYPLLVVVGRSNADVLGTFHERRRSYYVNAVVGSAIILAFGVFTLVTLSRRKRAMNSPVEGEACLIRDVTERKRVEQKALEQLKLAEAFFNHSISCLVVLDRDFNFLRVNEAYARACRLDISAFAGRNHFDMYPSDAKAIFEDVVRTRKPFHTFERAFVFPDQPERGVTHWEWALVPILDGRGEVEYLVFSLNEVTERKRAQDKFEQSMQRVQALSERVMKVQQEERAGIARELHDELGQTLTALKVNLQMLEPYCAEGEAESQLGEALMIVSRALEQVRSMALDLHPVGLEELGLAVALKSILAKQAQTAAWDWHFETTLPGRLLPELKMVCFRVVQEALTNVMRHAQAKQVWVMLGLNAGEVLLSVRDDGKGFDVGLVPDPTPTGGFGLISMQKRVEQMGGRLTIDSAPGRGTEVRATFPFAPADGRALNAGAPP